MLTNVLENAELTEQVKTQQGLMENFEGYLSDTCEGNEENVKVSE